MRQLVRVLAAVAIGMAALVLPAQSASADPSPTCQLLAGIPVASDSPTGPGGQALGSGARASQCIDTATLTVQLREDISFWPDKTLKIKSQSGRDIFIELLWECPRNGAGVNVFTETHSSLGGTVQSRRTNVQHCDA